MHSSNLPGQELYEKAAGKQRYGSQMPFRFKHHHKDQELLDGADAVTVGPEVGPCLCGNPLEG